MTKRQIIEKVCRVGSHAYGHPFLGYSVLIDDEQVICDAFRLYRLNDPITISDQYMSSAPYVIQGMKDTVDRIYLRAAQSVKEFLKVPDRAALEDFIKQVKSSSSYRRGFCIRYHFEQGYEVNAEWLLDTLILFGNNIVMSVASKYNYLIFESDQGDGMICMYKNDKSRRTNK